MPGHGFKAALLTLALLIGAAGASVYAVQPPRANAAHAAVLTWPAADAGGDLHLSPGDPTSPTLLAQEVVERHETRPSAGHLAGGRSRPHAASLRRPPPTPPIPDGGRLLGLLARPANAPPRS
jgi:hypothetical protein